MFGFIAGLLTVGVCAYIASPFFSPPKTSETRVTAKSRKSARAADKQSEVERQLQELEFDFRVGKLSQADFDLERGRLQESRSQLSQSQKTATRQVETLDPLEEEIARHRAKRHRGAKSSFKS